MPDDYKHDVFFSYKRHDLTLEWSRQVAQRLTLWLTEELGGRQARVFIDETIEIGDDWPEALRDALRHSRCMVCVWSPSYFQSNWCVSEWKSFLKREKIANLKPHGLIAPLKFHDGEHFPPAAREVEWEDVAPYAVTVPAFWTSPRAMELEDKLKPFARGVARIVRDAPAFQDWPIVKAQGLKMSKIRLAKL